MGRPKKEKVEESEIESKEEPQEIKGSDKKRALELAVASIEKQFGKGSIMTIRGYKNDEPLKYLSSGSLQLDSILGKGGFTFGTVAEIFGVESSGKSTLCLEIIAGAQRLGLTCAYIDKENDLDAQYAEDLGVNLEATNLSQPSTGEEALTIAERLIGSGAVDVIIFDSIAAINPGADLEKDLGENARMAGRASLLTRFFERSDAAIHKNKVLFICINQMRQGLTPYGPKTTTPGGMALKHACSYRLDLHIVEKITGPNSDVIGVKVRVKTVKNKLNSPFKEAFYDLIFGKGIDKVKDTVELAVQYGLIEKTGSWFTYKEDKFQGFPGATEFFADQTKFQELRKSVIDILNPGIQKEGKG